MDKGNNVWGSLEPATLDQLIRYKKGELSHADANAVERFLSEFDDELLDDLSVEQLESLKKIKMPGSSAPVKPAFGGLKIAAGVALLSGMLTLAYVLTKDSMDESSLAHNDETATEAVEEVHVDDAVIDDVVTEEIVTESETPDPATETESNGDVEMAKDDVIEESAMVEESAVAKVDTNVVVTEVEEMTADDMSSSSEPYKLAKKDKAVRKGEPVIYTIFEKYNDPQKRPSGVPKKARAFANSKKGVSKNTFKRKISPTFPGGDVALVEWLRNNYNGVLPAGFAPMDLSFKVTKKAKVTEVEFSTDNKELKKLLQEKFKEMPAWNPPESSYDPLDIYYSIRIAPGQP